MSLGNIYHLESAASLLVTLAYGCGPNLVIGAGGITFFSGSLIINRIRLGQSSKDLKENRFSSLEGSEVIKGRIYRDTEAIKNFAISMFPLIGPLLALRRFASSHGVMWGDT